MKLEPTVWLDMDVDIIEVAILSGSFWKVFRVRYDITAMLRVIGSWIGKWWRDLLIAKQVRFFDGAAGKREPRQPATRLKS